MPSREFERWWAHFRRSTAGEEPYDTARRLRRKLQRVKRADGGAFLKQLFEVLLKRHGAYGVALFLLDGISDPSHLEDIAGQLRPLPGPLSTDDESHLSDLIRVLAVADVDSLMPVVESYLLERHVGPHWDSVPWALWPHRRELFCRAWRRFFVENDPRDVDTTLIIKSFLSEPEAIRAVRDGLSDDPPEHWEALREALLRQAGRVSWLSSELREALERSVS